MIVEMDQVDHCISGSGEVACADLKDFSRDSQTRGIPAGFPATTPTVLAGKALVKAGGVQECSGVLDFLMSCPG